MAGLEADEEGCEILVILRQLSTGQQHIEVQVGAVPWVQAAPVLLMAYRVAERKALEAEMAPQFSPSPQLHLSPDMWRRREGN